MKNLSATIPSPQKINHCVRDALTMQAGGIGQPFYRAVSLHRLNAMEWSIAEVAWREANGDA